MKIGIYLGAQTPQLGGGFTFIDEVLRALFRRDAAGYTFVACAREEAWRPVMDGYGVPFVPLPKPPKGESRLARAQSLVRRILRRPRPAVRSNLEVLREAGVELLLNFSPFETATPDIPYISIIWDLQHRLQPMFPEVSSGKLWDYRERQCAPLFQRASRIIVGTAVGREEVRHFYGIPSERIRILPHPTPEFALEAATLETAPDLLERFNLPPAFFYYPAQFWSHKNHAALLLAARHLRETEGIRVSLVFSGSDQGNLAHLKSLVEEYGLGEQVFFLGFVSREELIALYRQALALVYVSFFGPENLPPLEAFALACPVIASRVSGAEEQLGTAALLVEPTDPVEIAGAMKVILQDAGKRAEIIALGRIRARRFTTEDFAIGLIAIFDELAKIRRCWA